MNFGLGKRELVLLRMLAATSGSHSPALTMTACAAKMNISVAAVSRATASLQAKGFIEIERDGKRKHVRFSGVIHAIAFSELQAANPQTPLEDVLSGSSIRVLSGMLRPPVSVETISRLSRTPEITARRALKKLLDRGMVSRAKPTEYAIFLPNLAGFVAAYSEFELRKRCAGMRGILNPWWPNAVFRTPQTPPAFMTPTGISVFHEHGIKIIQTEARDYYFNAFTDKPRPPTMEEAVVHALTWTVKNSSARETAYAMLVMQKNWKKFDRFSFQQSAADWGIPSIADRCITLVEAFVHDQQWPEPLIQNFQRVEGPIFPSRDEFGELVKQYE